MKHALSTSARVVAPSLPKCLRWLGAALTALVLIQLGVWLGRQDARIAPLFAALTPYNPQRMLPAQARRAVTGLDVGASLSAPLKGAAATSEGAAMHAADAEAKRQRVQHACRHAVNSLNPSCPRQLIVKYLESAGFGHQFTEMLFGMYAARYLGLAFTWNAVVTSGDHGDDYAGLVEQLGLERFFVDGLGLARADDLRELQGRTRRTTSKNSSHLFGQWINASSVDKHSAAVSGASVCTNSVLEIEGWWHCRGVAENNCFWAPEHAFLFNRFGRCLRAGVEAYGTAFDRGVFHAGGAPDDSDRHFLPHDELIVVWHMRFGDVQGHDAGDVFCANVVRALREILPEGIVKRVRIVLVGGGKGTRGVPERYVNELRGVVDAIFKGNESDLPRFQVERFNNSSFEAQFIAMMQADVLIGSGSSVPQVAALLSACRPLFFNHVAKHGYGYGQEAIADAVDMDADGRVLDSLRRVKVMLYERMMTREGDEEDGESKHPCQKRRAHSERV